MKPAEIDGKLNLWILLLQISNLRFRSNRQVFLTGKQPDSYSLSRRSVCIIYFSLWRLLTIYWIWI